MRKGFPVFNFLRSSSSSIISTTPFLMMESCSIRGARFAPSIGKAAGASPSPRLWHCCSLMAVKVIFLFFRDQMLYFFIPHITWNFRDYLQIIGQTDGLNNHACQQGIVEPPSITEPVPALVKDPPGHHQQTLGMISRQGEASVFGLQNPPSPFLKIIGRVYFVKLNPLLHPGKID